MVGKTFFQHPLTLLLLLLLENFHNSYNKNVVTGFRHILEQYTFQIDEGLPQYTPVAQIPNKSNEKNPTYNILKQDAGNSFDLTVSGQLITNRVFDYEELTEQQKSSGFSIHVEYGTSGFATVTVKIVSVNDNRPIFSVKSFIIRVREDINSTEDLSFPNARDPDAEQVVTYSIKHGNERGLFGVRRVTKESESRYVLALLKDQFLDLETKEENYTLIVSACELVSKKCSSLRVVIYVDDVNDNKPVFDLSLKKELDVSENASLSKPFFRVNATDPDRGRNGQIEYSIHDNNDFRIDSLSGDIYPATASALDAEQNFLRSFHVVAEDRGDPVERGSFFLTIKIVDCNDMVPELTIHPSNSDLASIMEGAPAGTNIGALTVIDLDRDAPNNQVSKVTLTEGTEFFMLNRTDDEELNGRTVVKYFILTLKEIDREIIPAVRLSISATDSGTPPLTSVLNYTVQVTDVNDNAPIFEKNVYRALINESAHLATRLIQVRAHDLDAGENGRVTYTIASKHERRWFTIHPDTGVIQLSEYIDREQTDSLSIRVGARDNGINMARESVVVVEVTVLDSNDNDPEFVNSNMAFSLEENNQLNVLIGKWAMFKIITSL